MLALQQKTNQRLRDLELANEEKSSLLRAALLDRNNLPPELLELKRVETLRHIRERINTVIKAPLEAQSSVLDTTSSEIAETILSSEAAMDKAKKVSIAHFSYHQSSSSTLDLPVLKTRKQRLEPSLSANTPVAESSLKKTASGQHRSTSGISTSTAGTGQTRWGRLVQSLTQQRKLSTVTIREHSSTLISNDGVASLSLAWLPRSIFYT